MKETLSYQSSVITFKYSINKHDQTSSLQIHKQAERQYKTNFEFYDSLARLESFTF